MVYLFPWIFLILGSLVASIGLFIWAYYNGQFSDQGRARYLPITGIDPRAEQRGQGRAAKKPYELIALLASAGAILLFTLVLALLKRNGG